MRVAISNPVITKSFVACQLEDNRIVQGEEPPEMWLSVAVSAAATLASIVIASLTPHWTAASTALCIHLVYMNLLCNAHTVPSHCKWWGCTQCVHAVYTRTASLPVDLMGAH